MADEAPAPAADAPAKPSGGGPNIILVGLTVVNLVIGVLTFLRVRKLPTEIPRQTVAPAGDGTAAAAEEPEKPGPVVALDPMIVNLNEPGKPRYLKASFEIEVRDADIAKLVEEQKRNVRDEVFRYLSSMSIADTVGEQNKAKLQAEIKTRLDKILSGGVKHIYFLDFMIQ